MNKSVKFIYKKDASNQIYLDGTAVKTTNTCPFNNQTYAFIPADQIKDGSLIQVYYSIS